jgi:hypothetical protein
MFEFCGPRFDDEKMSRLRGPVRWLILGLGLAICGCQALCGPQGIPDDPLYSGKKPKESPAVSAAPMDLTFQEPRMPSEPAIKSPLVNRNVPVPGRLTSDRKSNSQE